MLQIVVKGTEFFDERTQTFYETKDCILKLEHSLLSISKWESKWHKAYFGERPEDAKTKEEALDYVRCMSINSNVSNETILSLSNKNIKDIIDYIDNPMTATTIHSLKKGKKETLTSELIYYQMILCGIPFECEKWHLNRLLTLIKICIVKNDTRTMSRQDIIAQNRALNQARRKRLNTRG